MLGLHEEQHALDQPHTRAQRERTHMQQGTGTKLGLEAIQNSHEAAEERVHTWFHPNLLARSSCDVSTWESGNSCDF